MVNKIKHNWEFGLLHDKTNKIKGKENEREREHICIFSLCTFTRINEI